MPPLLATTTGHRMPITTDVPPQNPHVENNFIHGSGAALLRLPLRPLEHEHEEEEPYLPDRIIT
jgi:hypothetical protein